MGGVEETDTKLEGGSSEALSEPADLQRKEKVGRSIGRGGQPSYRRTSVLGPMDTHGDMLTPCQAGMQASVGVCLEESTKLSSAA